MRDKKVQQMGKKLTWIMHILLVLAVGSTLFLNHKLMVKSREYQDAFIKANLRNKASLLDYIFKDLSSNLEHLANSTEVTVYFRNVDLQMSLEYGLRLSLLEVQRKLEHFQSLKVMDGYKIFNCLAVMDADNNLVAHAYTGEDLTRLSLLKELMPKISSHVHDIFVFDYKGELNIAMFHPIYLQGVFKGTVFGFLDNRALKQVIAKGESGSRLFLVYNSLHYPMLEGELRDVVIQENKKSSFMVFQTELTYFPIKLVELVDPRAIRGGLPPSVITFMMGFLAFGLLISGFYLQRVYEKKEIVQRINEELTEEVEARKRAEELLRRAQEELEQKIQERTKELLAKNLELENEIKAKEEMESQLRKRENLYRELYAEYDAILKNVPEIISVYDAHGRILWSNSKEDAHEDIFQLLAQEYIQSGMRVQREIATKDGRIFDVSVSGIRDENGHLVKVLETRREITDRKEMESAFMELQKFESLATLASGIAHDFNNILGGIMGFAELGLRGKEDPNKMKSYFEKILVGVERGSDLVNQILMFSRSKDKAKKHLLLNSIIKETFKMLRATIPTYISMDLSIPKKPIRVLANPTEIQQVLMNLCINARDAVAPEGGEIKVVMEEDEDLKEVVLKVVDNGCGIRPEIKDRIFEPYFTTKPKGKGTGLGLSIVYGIVKSLGGKIEVRSEVGKGACFIVRIPYVDENMEKVEGEEIRFLKGGKGNILVVDDEAFMVEILVGMLKELGYEPHGLKDPQEALKEIVGNQCRYDALITDFAMPSMSGVALAREVRARNVKIPIIMITGYTQMEQEDLDKFGINKILKKPVDIHELSRVVWEALSLKRDDSCA